MKRTGIIRQVLPMRSGTGRNGEWKFTPVEVEWEEPSADGISTERYSAVMDVKGDLNQQALQLAIQRKTCVEFAIYFNTNTWEKNGEMHTTNSCRGYLNKEQFGLSF